MVRKIRVEVRANEGYRLLFGITAASPDEAMQTARELARERWENNGVRISGTEARVLVDAQGETLAG